MPDIKKILLQKKVDSVMYDVYPKTSADIVVYTKGTGAETVDTTVAAELAALASDLAQVSTTENVESMIDEATTNLYNRILGITGEEGDTVAAAYDTLKEVAQYIEGHGSVVAGFTADINALKTALGETPDPNASPAVAGSGVLKEIYDLKTRVTALETTVGNSSSGLVKQANDIQTRMGMDDTTGLSKRIVDLEAVGSTKVEASNTNGNIKIDGAETQVYDDTALVNGLGTATDEAAAAGTTAWSRIKNAESDIDALQAGTVTAVTKNANTDGVIDVTVNGVASQVVAYTGDPTVVDQDATHRFVTDDQVTNWTRAAEVKLVSTAPTAADADANDLYLVELA